MPFPKLPSTQRISFFVFVFVALTFIFVKVRQVHSVKPFIKESYAISWDIYGYYLHLPAIIIHHDPGMENKAWLDSLNNTYEKDRPFYQAWPGQKNRLVNVYPLGVAISDLPFFMVAHISAGWFGYPRDGLSPPYQVMKIFGALFYGIFGMWLLRKLLLRYFRDSIAAVVLAAIGLGTNLYYYATYDCCMPHISLFFFDTLIILLTIRWHENPKRITALLIGMLLGLITISRPSEIVWVLIPLLWNVSGWNPFKAKMRLLGKNFFHVILLLGGMVAVGSLQLLYWRYTSGHWFSNNHVEGFDFFRPFTLKVLFSYKKGWLLYTPVMALCILGFIVLYKKQRALFVPFFLFFLANLWFISSWECWWYAGSFGQRSFVQSYGLMAIPLGFLIQWFAVTKLKKAILGTLLAFFVLLNQFQSWQIIKGVLHYELMTKAFYWKVFGRTEAKEEWKKLLEIDRGNAGALDDVLNDYLAKTVFTENYENKISANDLIICDTLAASGKKSRLLNARDMFALGFTKPFDSLTNADHLRIRLWADVYLTSDSASGSTSFVFAMTGSRGQAYCYTRVPIDTSMAKPGKWCRVHADFITPEILHRDDKVCLQIWNSENGKVLIDNIELVMYEPKQYP